MLISFCYTASSTSYIFVYLLCLHMLQFNCLKPNNTLLFHKKFSIASNYIHWIPFKKPTKKEQSCIFWETYSKVELLVN